MDRKWVGGVPRGGICFDGRFKNCVQRKRGIPPIPPTSGNSGLQGFQLGIKGGILDKMTTNCLNIEKSAFFGQNSGGCGRATSQLFKLWGGGESLSPPTRGNPGP